MKMTPLPRIELAASPRNSTTVTAPKLTLFALPKSFSDGTTRLIQENAIRSWCEMSPAVEVILFGDDFGVEEMAQHYGVQYGGPLRRNARGTPLLSDAFYRAHQLAQAPYLMYTNADVIFQTDLLSSVEQVEEHVDQQPFLIFGRRFDVPVDRAVDLSHSADREWLLNQVKTQGEKSPVVCKEYFIFPRGLFEIIPEFAVGRGNWDNWMIYRGRQLGIPVVNASERLLAIHQRHHYRHIRTSRWGCYVSCPEARENQRLAGGRHFIRGSCGTHRLTSQGLQAIAAPEWNRDFWRDFGNFMRMMARIPFER